MEEADHSLMSMAGLDDDEDTFGSVWQTARRRRQCGWASIC